MATLGLIKNGHKEKLGVMPGTYPANRVNYNNNESGMSATNVQDAIDELASGGGGGGGHVIEDNSGTDMPQEENLQFVGVYTEDDATNDRTKVNIVREMTSTQMQSLTTAQKKGFIHTTDEPDNPYEGDSIKVVYDQYFNLTGTGAVYIDIDKDYPVDGYKLIGLTIASNIVGYVAQARIRNASRITGFVQKANGGVIATSETVPIGVTLIYSKV